jgi:hypothetical protein
VGDYIGVEMWGKLPSTGSHAPETAVNSNPKSTQVQSRNPQHEDS